MGWLAMSERELNPIEVLSEVETGRLRVEDAAGLLGLSPRQVFRLLTRFRADGPSGLAHKARGRAPNNAIGVAWRAQVLDLIRLQFADFRPTFAAEKLAELHDIHISHETLRKWMIAEGLWLSRKHRRVLHQPGLRREARGELVQIDGSEHRWFEDGGPACTLLVFIDLRPAGSCTSGLSPPRAPSAISMRWRATFRSTAGLSPSIWTSTAPSGSEGRRSACADDLAGLQAHHRQPYLWIEVLSKHFLKQRRHRLLRGRCRLVVVVRGRAKLDAGVIIAERLAGGDIDQLAIFFPALAVPRRHVLGVDVSRRVARAVEVVERVGIFRHCGISPGFRPGFRQAIEVVAAGGCRIPVVVTPVKRADRGRQDASSPTSSMLQAG